MVASVGQQFCRLVRLQVKDDNAFAIATYSGSGMDEWTPPPDGVWTELMRGC